MAHSARTTDTAPDARLVMALEAAARHEPCGRVRARLLAVRYLLAGHSPDEAAGVFGLSRSSLYRLRAQFAAGGIEALRDRPRSGAPQRLAHRHEAAFLARLHAGPPRSSGLAAWRGEDLRALLAREFGAHYSLSGVYALLHRLGQSDLVPRPQHPDADPSAQAAFIKKSASRYRPRAARAS